jgi:hypothetical protein
MARLLPKTLATTTTRCGGPHTLGLAQTEVSLCSVWGLSAPGISTYKAWCRCCVLGGKREEEAEKKKEKKKDRKKKERNRKFGKNSKLKTSKDK